MQEYKEVDVGGYKIRIKKFDYNTPEGWEAWKRETYGSIQDESFVRPRDAYIIPDCEVDNMNIGQPKRKFNSRDEWEKWVNDTSGSITDETFTAPEDAYILTDYEKSILSRC